MGNLVSEHSDAPFFLLSIFTVLLSTMHRFPEETEVSRLSIKLYGGGAMSGYGHSKIYPDSKYTK